MERAGAERLPERVSVVLAATSMFPVIPLAIVPGPLSSTFWPALRYMPWLLVQE